MHKYDSLISGPVLRYRVDACFAKLDISQIPGSFPFELSLDAYLKVGSTLFVHFESRSRSQPLPPQVGEEYVVHGLLYLPVRRRSS